MNFQKKMLAITPICCLFCYLLIGFTIGEGYFSGAPNRGAWGWGLLVFLLVPLMPYLVGTKKIVFTVTMAVTLIYVVGCLLWSAFMPESKPIWHPAWIIFLLIPAIKILVLPSEEDKKKEKNNDNKNDDDNKVYEAK